MKKLDPKDTICRELWAYPVVDLAKPRVRQCCKRAQGWLKKGEVQEFGIDAFLNQPDVMHQRDLMMQGYQIEECKACWDLENNDQKSFRLGPMDFQFQFNNDKGNPVHFTKFRPFEQLIEEKDTLLRSEMPNKLDITLGNHCDLKCIYCSHTYSSQWENEINKFGLILTDPDFPVRLQEVAYEGYKDDLDLWYNNFVEWFNSIAMHLERIAILGGEPTTSPQFIPLSSVISKALTRDSHPNATVCIVTNLNWKPQVLDRIIEFRKELPSHVKFKIEISMESFGNQAEYIRNGVKWDRFTHNFEAISKIENIELVPITTLNALCIPSLKKYLEFVKKIEEKTNKHFFIIANRLVYPKWLSTNILNQEHEFYLDETIKWLRNNYKSLESKEELVTRLEEIRQDLYKPKDLNLLGYFSKWIKEMDRRRNTNFSETFPELASLFDEGSKHTKPRYFQEDMKEWGFL